MNIWLVSREYAGIAEAGGVKNVACSLSESLVKLNNRVTLFIPLYNCSNIEILDSFDCIWKTPVTVSLAGKTMPVTFSHGKLNGVEIVFIGNKSFSEKKAVYTYTREDEKQNPAHRCGCGHEDALFLDTLFQKSVAAYANACSQEEAPDIIHCQDATAAMVPAFIKDKTDLDALHQDFYINTRCVVTIHNAGPGYHHEFADESQALFYTNLNDDTIFNALNGKVVEPFLLGAENAELTTVSPQYAEEIMEGKTETAGLDQCFRDRRIFIKGITNGIDFDRYNPLDTDKSGLPYAYDPSQGDFVGKLRCRHELLEKYCQPSFQQQMSGLEDMEKFGYIDNVITDKTIFFAYHGRVVGQKGISILSPAADLLLEKGHDVRFILIGQGQPDLEQLLITLCQKYPGKCIYFRGYDKNLSRLCLAAADFALLPSIFEPCCLEDFICQILGTVPVANRTGGLGKIIEGKTGYLYSPNTAETLCNEMDRLCNEIEIGGQERFNAQRKYASNYVKSVYSWDIVAKEEYISLYDMLLQKNQ